MDAVLAERINLLARSLKELHLAATNDEAFRRAEEILLGSSSEAKEEKTLNELMGESEKPKEQPKEEQNASMKVEEVIIASQESVHVDTNNQNQPEV